METPVLMPNTQQNHDDVVIPPMIEEREPGVYVRSQNSSRELDFLWDAQPNKRPYDISKNNVAYFLGGLLVGAVLTLVLCLAVLMVNQYVLGQPAANQAPQTPEANITTEDVMKPATVNEPPAPVAVKPAVQPQQQQPVARQAKVETSKAAAAKPVATTPTVMKGGTTYAVKSGDTIGGIAYKFYGDSSPEMVDRIQKANKLSNVHAIQIDQQLVIPAAPVAVQKPAQ